MDPPCDDIPDFELIRRMADRALDSAAARFAWGLFYQRHERSVLRLFSARYAYLFRLDEVTDIVHDGFMRAFERAATFDCREVCDPLAERQKCRAWLITIIANLVRDRFRDQPDVALVAEDPEAAEQPDTADPDPTQGQVPESDRLRLLRAGFALLSTTEQTVLHATMSWWQPDQENQRMPHTALQRLSEETGKSAENIRQIRSRAIRKLTKYINDGLNNEKND
jgi:RNA polymerase sigma factor (sigma-70 family)